MDDLLSKIRTDLLKNSDEKVKISGQKFFKEEIKLLGVKAAGVNKIAKEYFKSIHKKSKKDIFIFCEKLWQSGYLEESFIACKWSYFKKDEYEPEDFKTFENWLNLYISNWAACDTFCNHTVGTFLEMYPEFLTELKKWAKSDNRWVRRASAVSLIIPARKGKFLNDIFEIADILLTDEDDLVQKGYGWLLKASGEAKQNEIFQYVIENKNKMPRTALRYAIEKMPPELRKKAMEK